jgi:hypothetical protein
VEHACVGDLVSIGQMGKLPPGALLRQHLEQQIEGVSGCQQRQQMDAPQLRRAEMTLPTTRVGVRPLFAEKSVGNERRELIEQRSGAGHRKQRIHGQEGYPKKTGASASE